MNDNECTKKADLILSILGHKANVKKSKEEKIQMIKPIIGETFEFGKNVGRRQVLNYMQDEINGLRNNF